MASDFPNLNLHAASSAERASSLLSPQVRRALRPPIIPVGGRYLQMSRLGSRPGRKGMGAKRDTGQDEEKRQNGKGYEDQFTMDS